MTLIPYVALELALAVATTCLVFGLGLRHWRTMSPARAVARIVGWYLIAIGTVALLIELLDVPVPGRVMSIYVAEIAFGYVVKAIAGSSWPVPRQPRSTSNASGASPRV